MRSDGTEHIGEVQTELSVDVSHAAGHDPVAVQGHPDDGLRGAELACKLQDLVGDICQVAIIDNRSVWLDDVCEVVGASHTYQSGPVVDADPVGSRKAADAGFSRIY